MTAPTSVHCPLPLFPKRKLSAHYLPKMVRPDSGPLSRQNYLQVHIRHEHYVYQTTFARSRV